LQVGSQSRVVVSFLDALPLRDKLLVLERKNTDFHVILP